MDRVILHSDLNNFYASVECMDNPELRNKPVAVSGSPENRHGIVLAKNMPAKRLGIKTGDTICEAMQKCPDIVFVPPRFDRYIELSKAVRDIYYEYTDLIEPFGIDECWLDVTQSIPLYPSGYAIANEIRQRVKKEIGITVSIGVSFNKIFAKLGSDMKKPDAITVIDKDTFKDTIWNLPISELLYAGKATTKKLKKLNIFTIGDMARANPLIIRQELGKNGATLQLNAMGLDMNPVKKVGFSREIKSIGNGTTTPFDIVSEDDIRIVIRLLSESVAKRLREKSLYATTVQIAVRYNNLKWFSLQGNLDMPSNTTTPILNKSLSLIHSEYIQEPIRSLSVRCCNLIQSTSDQSSMFSSYRNIEQQRQIEFMTDSIRKEYGWSSLQKAIMLVNKRLSGLNPTDDNTLQKIAFFKG